MNGKKEKYRMLKTERGRRKRERDSRKRDGMAKRESYNEWKVERKSELNIKRYTQNEER